LRPGIPKAFINAPEYNAAAPVLSLLTPDRHFIIRRCRFLRHSRLLKVIFLWHSGDVLKKIVSCPKILIERT
jgi:hypothetical protein